MSTLYERAAIIPGRSLTRSKAPDRLLKAWAVDGAGAQVWDSEGRTYLDMVCGLGAISLGYHRTAGTMRFNGRGVYSLPHVREVEAAEAVLEHVAPWASSVRFTKTGSEATHAAYRIAKAATGRSLVLMGDWAYHGWHEWCADRARDTIRYPHGQDFSENDADNGFHAACACDDVRLFSEGTIAAVFIEPHRFEPVDVEWLKSVRAFCDRAGALLVFDSMLYGGRWALGGASEYFGVQPDLECFGKAFGNGEAVAFIVGNQALAEHGELVSGTFSGDVTGLSAVCDVLHTYVTEPVIATLWARGQQLKDGLQQVLPTSFATIDGSAPLLRMQYANPAHKVAFKDAMAARGVLMYPDWFMTMYAHTEEQINQVIEAAEASCQTLS